MSNLTASTTIDAIQTARAMGFTHFVRNGFLPIIGGTTQARALRGNPFQSTFRVVELVEISTPRGVKRFIKTDTPMNPHISWGQALHNIAAPFYK